MLRRARVDEDGAGDRRARTTASSTESRASRVGRPASRAATQVRRGGRRPHDDGRVHGQRRPTSRRWSPTCDDAARARARAAAARGARERHTRARQAAAARARRAPAATPARRSSSSRRWPPRSMYDGDAPGAGHRHRHRPRVRAASASIVANDATVKGGTYYPMTVKKHLRAQEVALHNRLPCIYLVDSGGAFLPLQDEVFPDREHFGRIFFNQATMSARGHPADRRGAWARAPPAAPTCPAMSDETRDRPRAGHDLPRRPAAGEGGDRRGGHRRGARRRRPARAHVAASSTTWPTTTSTRCEIVRAIVATLPPQAPRAVGARAPSSRPRVDPDDALRRRARRRRARPTTPREVIAPHRRRQRSFHEFKALYGTTLVIGFAHIHGHPVGILANNGILFSESRAQGRALHRAVRPARRSRCCSCRTSPASWSAASTRRAGSPRTARSWSPPSPARACRS